MAAMQKASAYLAIGAIVTGAAVGPIQKGFEVLRTALTELTTTADTVGGTTATDTQTQPTVPK